MASVSSTISANQYGLQQLGLQEARRWADQAEKTAQSLEAQANSAQREADRARQNASSMAASSDQAQAKAEEARQRVVNLSSQQSVVQLSQTTERVVTRQFSLASMSTSPLPVVNSQGQVTGKIINTTA